MSWIAGLILLVYGSASAYLGISEIQHVYLLTRYAALWTTVIGIVLFLVGLAYFKAPHKAFLASVPLLVYFHVQMYFNALFYFARPLWPQQLSVMAVSLLTVLLGYYGYKSRSKAAR